MEHRPYASHTPPCEGALSDGTWTLPSWSPQATTDTGTDASTVDGGAGRPGVSCWLGWPHALLWFPRPPEMQLRPRLPGEKLRKWHGSLGPHLCGPSGSCSVAPVPTESRPEPSRLVGTFKSCPSASWGGRRTCKSLQGSRRCTAILGPRFLYQLQYENTIS